MRKTLLVAASAAVLAMGAMGAALAQEGGHGGGRHNPFHGDANADGVLTRAEFDTGHGAMFAQIDADNNGQLSREEMRAHHGEHGRRHGGGHGHNLSRADANNDGNITRDEFLAHPSEMFARLDANNDGVISAAERPQRRAHGERGERRERGEHGGRPDHPNPDADGDGSVSRAEFTAHGAQMFDRLDGNDDGRVTREEAQAAHQHRHGHD